MKLTETISCDTSSSTIAAADMSKFPCVFKKRNNGKVPGPTKDVVPAKVEIIGFTPEDLQKRRLNAFVRGIEVSGTGIMAGFTNMMNEFKINVDTFDYDNLTFDLHRVSPKGLVDIGLEHEMTEFGNHIRITYGLDKPGQYVMDIKYLGLAVPLSPFKIEIHDADSINVKDVVAYGKGLKRCLAGDVTTFQVETKKIAYAHITVAVDGHVDVPVVVSECKTGYKVQYVATTPGNFFFRVKLNGKHIPGSPFLVRAEKKHEIPEPVKKLFKKGSFKAAAERGNELQP